MVNSLAGTTTLDLWPKDARPVAVTDTTNIDSWLITIATGTGVGVTPASTARLHPHPDIRYVPFARRSPRRTCC